MRRRKAPSSGTLPLYQQEGVDPSIPDRAGFRTKRRRHLLRQVSVWWCSLIAVALTVTTGAVWWFSHLETRKMCSYGRLNDDYCDCPDGSDEPNTSACSHLLVQQPTFHCANGSLVLFASRVSDGIQDCPDGSDEVPLPSGEWFPS